MIDGLGGRLAVPATRPAATTAPVANVAKARTAADLSPLATAVRDMAAAPPVDTAKVDRVKSAIALGTYQVQPGLIADKMIAADVVRG